jgi:NAD(P)H-quinone oxidoreductase subunit 5
MTLDNTPLLLLAAPAAMLIVSLAAIRQPGPRPALVERLSIGAAAFSLYVAATAIAPLINQGPMQSALLGWQSFGLSIRLDPLSVIMFTMIALLSFNIVHFSRSYMDGDSRQGVFLGRLSATIASVQLLALSGNLGILIIAWILTSLTLHGRLVFYRERRGAVVAARNKFIAARIGDAALIGAGVLLFQEFGTGDLEAIFTGLQVLPAGAGLPAAVEGAAVLIAIAAILKAAQFPTHSWLVEVMETPTPVSALLHAGIPNAGPFLAVRLSFLLEQATVAPLLLIAFGGVTALFASKALMAQHSIKVGLGYSSAAHMGFMLMVCGLGVYAAAILQLVADSFYKAPRLPVVP